MSWWSNITRDRPPRSAGSGGRRPSVYETRELIWRDRLRVRLGRGKRPAPIPENPVWVQGTGAESGRLIGVLDADGELVRFPEPPADRPETWPSEWWCEVGEFRL